MASPFEALSADRSLWGERMPRLAKARERALALIVDNVHVAGSDAPSEREYLGRVATVALEAFDHADAGRLRQALALLNRVIFMLTADGAATKNVTLHLADVAKSRSVALQYQGKILALLGMSEEATAALESAIREYPGNTEAYVDLGIVLGEHGQVSDGLETVSKAILLDSKLALAHAARGTLLTMAGSYHEAVQSFEYALRLDPSSSEYFLDFPIALANSARPDEALAAAHRSLSTYPDSIFARCALGIVLVQMRRPKEAEPVFREATVLSPTCAVAAANLGGVLQELGRPAEAMESLARALELDPENIGALINLAATLAQQERYAEARELLERATALSTLDPLVSLNQATLLYNEGQYEAALEAAEVAPTAVQNRRSASVVLAG